MATLGGPQAHWGAEPDDPFLDGRGSHRDPLGGLVPSVVYRVHGADGQVIQAAMAGATLRQPAELTPSNSAADGPCPEDDPQYLNDPETAPPLSKTTPLIGPYLGTAGVSNSGVDLPQKGPYREPPPPSAHERLREAVRARRRVRGR